VSEAELLTLVWAVVIALAIALYVILDGFDLGLGILFPLAPSDADRDAMMNSIAPVWDGNETWLVLGGISLLAAFPLAYAVILPAAYIPILMMVMALVLRGVAFEFRFKAGRSRFVWDAAFAGGSTLAALGQGLVLGAFIQGFPVEGGRYAGGAFGWLTPFSLMTGAGLVCGYALLGATWLIWKTDGTLQKWSRRAARPALLAVLAFIGIVSLWTPLAHPMIAERWFAWPNLLYLSPVPLVTAALALLTWRTIGGDYDRLPFAGTVGLFLLSFLGLGISLWPYAVPPRITIWEAAAQPASQLFMLVGVLILIPLILAYTGYSYWVFRGKVRSDHYHH
jgi:cytochrome bd ubiquinol oxidase subunit II